MRWWIVCIVWIFIILGWWDYYHQYEYLTRQTDDGGEGAFYQASPDTNYPKSDYINYVNYSSRTYSTVSADTLWYPGGYDYSIRIPGVIFVGIGGMG